MWGKKYVDAWAQLSGLQQLQTRLECLEKEPESKSDGKDEQTRLTLSQGCIEHPKLPDIAGFDGWNLG